MFVSFFLFSLSQFEITYNEESPQAHRTSYIDQAHDLGFLFFMIKALADQQYDKPDNNTDVFLPDMLSSSNEELWRYLKFYLLTSLIVDRCPSPRVPMHIERDYLDSEYIPFSQYESETRPQSRRLDPRKRMAMFYRTLCELARQSYLNILSAVWQVIKVPLIESFFGTNGYEQFSLHVYTFSYWITSSLTSHCSLQDDSCHQSIG